LNDKKSTLRLRSSEGRKRGDYEADGKA